MEIERKWRIGGFPQGLPELERARVEQSYLCTRPTVRIRKKEQEGRQSFRLCIKGEGGLVREDVELDLPEESYLRLLALVQGDPIRKDYRVYALPGGHRLECSLVDAGSPREFYYAEVEFDSKEEAVAFRPPACLGEELTAQPGQSMSAYWERTRGPAKA